MMVLFDETLSMFGSNVKYYFVGADSKSVQINAVVASGYPDLYTWNAKPISVTFDPCANLAVAPVAGVLDFLGDILQGTDPVVFHTCGYVTSE